MEEHNRLKEEEKLKNTNKYIFNYEDYKEVMEDIDENKKELNQDKDMIEHIKYLKEIENNKILEFYNNLNDNNNLFILHDFSNGINLLNSSDINDNNIKQNKSENYYIFHDSSNGINEINLVLNIDNNDTKININNEDNDKDLFLFHDSSNGLGNYNL